MRTVIVLSALSETTRPGAPSRARAPARRAACRLGLGAGRARAWPSRGARRRSARRALAPRGALGRRSSAASRGGAWRALARGALALLRRQLRGGLAAPGRGAASAAAPAAAPPRAQPSASGSRLPRRGLPARRLGRRGLAAAPRALGSRLCSSAIVRRPVVSFVGVDVALARDRQGAGELALGAAARRRCSPARRWRAGSAARRASRRCGARCAPRAPRR